MVREKKEALLIVFNSRKIWENRPTAWAGT